MSACIIARLLHCEKNTQDYACLREEPFLKGVTKQKLELFLPSAGLDSR